MRRFSFAHGRQTACRLCKGECFLSKQIQAVRRQGENEIAVRVPTVIDIEAAFDTDKEPSESEFESDGLRQGRVDLVTLAEDGRIVFTEVKLFKNRELTSSRVPAVCGHRRQPRSWNVRPPSLAAPGIRPALP